MNFSDTGSTLTSPGAAGAVYGKVMRETKSAREIEQHVFDKITAALEDADLEDTDYIGRINALHHNRELWMRLVCDLAHDENQLPATLRARLISLGLWVMKETRRLLIVGGSLTDLVEVNRSIMRGLAAGAEGTS
jgi:flagellar biosynthesis activator protein FlaF